MHALDKEVVGEGFKRQASPRESIAAATAAAGRDLERGENGENWPLTVTTDSDAANATNEATQKEKSATAAEGEGEEEGHGQGHILTGRDGEGQKHDGSGGLESVSFDADDMAQVKRLMEAESITEGTSGGGRASQAARAAAPEHGALSRGTIRTENEDESAPLTKLILEGDGDEADVRVRRGPSKVSSAAVQKKGLQSVEDGHVEGEGQKEGQGEKVVPEGVGQSGSKGVPISEKFECDDPSCEVCEWLDRYLKTTLDESSLTTVVEEFSRTIEVEKEGGKESDEAVQAEGGLEDVRTDAAAAVVSSSIAHKDAPQNGGGGGGDLVHAAAGRMPDGAGGGGEGVAKEPPGEARSAGTTRRRESEFANALERDISRRDEEREGGSGDGGGAHRGQKCERERDAGEGDGRGESIASDKKEVGDNCPEEETAAEEGEEGKPSESNRNGDAPFREDGGGEEEGEIRRGGDMRERRAVQIVVDGAAEEEEEEDAGANLLGRASALLSSSMPEIGDRNRLSAEASRNHDEVGNTKSRGKPPPPKMRIALPTSVDQHLLDQCQRETNMSRLSSSLGRMKTESDDDWTNI